MLPGGDRLDMGAWFCFFSILMDGEGIGGAVVVDNSTEKFGIGPNFRALGAAKLLLKSVEEWMLAQGYVFAELVPWALIDFFGERQPVRWTSGHFSFYSFPFNGSVVFGERQPLRWTSGHFCLKNYGSGMFGERQPLRWTSGRLGHVGPTRSREMLEPAAFGPTWASKGGSVISAQLVG